MYVIQVYNVKRIHTISKVPCTGHCDFTIHRDITYIITITVVANITELLTPSFVWSSCVVVASDAAAVLVFL